MKDKVFKACLNAIEKDGFKAFSFTKVSQTTNIPLTTFYKHFQSPIDVVITLFQKIDEAVLKSFKPSEDLSPKDALFDILMARFDAAAPYKSVIKSFWKDWIFAPNEFPSLACQGYTSMAWMLDAAGLNSQGLKGMVRIQGLMGLYLLTLRTWLTDDSADLGKTMVTLDDGLSKLETAATFLHF